MAHKLHLFSPQVDVLINGVVVFVNKRITKSYSTLVQLSVTFAAAISFEICGGARFEGLGLPRFRRSSISLLHRTVRLQETE